MAYMSQERKKTLTPAIKAILAKYGVKASLAVRHHSTLVLNIKSGEIDFIADAKAQGTNITDHYIQVNPYWYKEHFSGKAKAFFSKVIPLMNVGNHDNSDPMTDYFDVGWYISVNVGQWDQPYMFTGRKEAA